MHRFPEIVLCVSALTICFAAAAMADDAGGDGEAKKTSTAQQISKVAVFTYRQSGGFIGARRLYEQKLKALPDGDRSKLAKLIQASGLLAIKGEQKLTKGACDVFYYDFTLKDGGTTHHAVFDDETLPQSYRPLVDYLKDKVTDEKRIPPQTEAK